MSTLSDKWRSEWEASRGQFRSSYQEGRDNQLLDCIEEQENWLAERCRLIEGPNVEAARKLEYALVPLILGVTDRTAFRAAIEAALAGDRDAVLRILREEES